jgi:hypothetical protein
MPARDMGLPTSDRAYVFGISNIMKDTTDQSHAKLRVIMVQEDVLLGLKKELQRRHIASEEHSVKSESRSAVSPAQFDATITTMTDDPKDKANWFRSGIWQGLTEMAMRYQEGTQGICGSMMRIDLAVPAGWLGNSVNVGGSECGGTERPT